MYALKGEFLSSFLQSSLTVRVLLEDINEHRPMFPKNHYIINLPEVTDSENVKCIKIDTGV